MMKKFVLSLFISCGALVASAAPTVNNLRDTIEDHDIVPPTSFETDYEILEKNWYNQNYTILAQPKENNTTQVTPTDELYIERLQRLQNEMGFTIEMPYNSVVKSYIEMYTGSRRKKLVEKMLGMWLYYEPIFEAALEKEGMPLELKYLPIIESALNPNAVSPAGAAGLWQFILSTGRGMGLEVNSLVDERRDTYKASQKAAEFLKSLYNTYNDWSLAIAAYNCGPGNVNKAIRRAGGGKKDYWEIYNYLPKETRGYVPAFIAAAYVMNYHNEHGISAALAKKPLLTDTVHVSRRINFKQIADVIDLDVNAIEALNPQYRKNIIPGSPNKPYVLILPSKQIYSYVMSENTIGTHEADKYALRETAEPGVRRSDKKETQNNESNSNNNSTASASTSTSTSTQSGNNSNNGYTSKEEVIIHEVKSGETLKSIANKYGTNTSRIKKDNGLTSNTVSRGQTLKITTYKKVLAEEGSSSTVSSGNSESSKSTQSASTSTSKKKSYSSTSRSSKKKVSSDDNKSNVKKDSRRNRSAKKSYSSGKTSKKSASTSKSSSKSKKKSTASKSTSKNKKKSSTSKSSSKSKSKASSSKSSSKKKTSASKSSSKSKKKESASKSSSKSKKSSASKSSSKSKSKASTSKSKSKSSSKKSTSSKSSSKKSSSKSKKK